VKIFLHIFILVDVLVNIIGIFKFSCLCDVSRCLMLNKENIFSSMASGKARIWADIKNWFLCQGGVYIFLFSNICIFLGLIGVVPCWFLIVKWLEMGFFTKLLHVNILIVSQYVTKWLPILLNTLFLEPNISKLILLQFEHFLLQHCLQY
jgi:hypothetical protein